MNKIEIQLGPCGSWVIFLSDPQTQAMKEIAKPKGLKYEALLEEMVSEFIRRHSFSQLKRVA
jgi:hypothetical protein